MTERERGLVVEYLEATITTLATLKSNILRHDVPSEHSRKLIANASHLVTSITLIMCEH